MKKKLNKLLKLIKKWKAETILIIICGLLIYVFAQVINIKKKSQDEVIKDISKTTTQLEKQAIDHFEEDLKEYQDKLHKTQIRCIYLDVEEKIVYIIHYDDNIQILNEEFPVIITWKPNKNESREFSRVKSIKLIKEYKQREKK